MDETEKDVKGVVKPTDDSKENGHSDEDKGDDKSKNFAELRKQLADKDAELAELRKKVGDKEESGRSLGDDEEDEDGGESKKGKQTVEQVIFARDKKEAVREWSKDKKVAPEVWEKVKNKVVLKGDETKSEILEKIDEAYQSLPEVRQAREKQIADKARKEAMSEFQDDELDLGGGGEIDLGGGGAEPRFTPRETKFLDSMGVSAKERKGIDKNANPNKWTPGKNPTRKAFQPGS